ncbi:MAG: PEP-utilizing protein mobile subunit, partial [Tepidisphaerales bacterium]
MTAPAKSNAFPLPSEIGDVPGTEGWQNMYPYFTRFRPEDDKVFWFYNAMHFPEPMPAFDVVTAEIPYQGLGAFTTRVFSFPTTLGVDHRIVNGRIYITAYPVTDPAEIGRRLGLFQERAGFYYQNWDRLYAEWKERMLALIKEVEDIRVPPLPEFDDIEVVTSGRGIGQNHYVREAYHRCIEAFSKMWHYHFEFLMLGYGAYLVFFQFCKKAFPEITDQTVARMVAGIDVFMFRPDEELKKLARLAVELGIDGKFGDDVDPADTMLALGQMGDAGRKWLDQMEKSRHPWFLMSTGDGFYHHHRSWNDDLSVPFSAIARYIGMLKKGQSIERPTEKLKVERKHIISEYRGLLSTDEERGAFDQMLGLCHLVFPFVEDHKFYCEHWFTTIWFNKLREFGALLARWGVIADAEDFFHLHHTEADLALQEVSLAWAAGSVPAGRGYWKPILKERKRIWEKLKEWSPPPALGPIPDDIADPAVQMLWGITSETLASWAR